MTKLSGKTARAFCRIAMPLAALAADPDVGGSVDDAPDEIFEPFAEFLAAVIRGDAEQMRAATEDIVEARTGAGRDNSRSNDVTRHGRKRSVLLKREGDDSTERGVTKHGRKAGVLIPNE